MGWLVESKGALVANANCYYMHSIDIATGNRTMLSCANPSAMLGTGGQIGNAFNLASPDGSAILTTGDSVPEAFSGFQSSISRPAIGRR